MKIHGTLLAIALGVAFQVAAAPQADNPSAYNNTDAGKKLHLLNPQYGSPDKNKIERVGNMSSQPWAKTVGWHPGTSAFPDADTHESQLILLEIGHEPQKF